MEEKQKYMPGGFENFYFTRKKLAVKFCDYFIADSLAIQKYLQSKYNVPSKFIAYGAEIPGKAEESDLEEKGLVKHNYFLIIARMEPEK